MIDLKSVSSRRVVCYMSCTVLAVQRVACCTTCRGCRLHLINVKSESPLVLLHLMQSSRLCSSELFLLVHRAAICILCWLLLVPC